MGKIKEFIKTNPSLRFLYRGLKRYKDRYYGAFHAKQVYKQSKQALYKQLHPPKAILAKESSSSVSLPKQPTFTVVVSVSTASEQLSSLVDSMLDQTYQKWELFLVPQSSDPLLRSSLQKLTALDLRIQLFDTTQKPKNTTDTYNGNGNIEYGFGWNKNSVEFLLFKANGSYFAFLEENSSLHPSALFEIATALTAHDADFLYTDSCLIEGDLYTPRYKPDFAPDTLRSMNYIGSFAVVADSLLKSIGDSWSIDNLYDLWFLCIEKASCIHHIPEVLHYRYPGQLGEVGFGSEASSPSFLSAFPSSSSLSSSPSCSDKTAQVLRLSYEIIGNPLVSIIIPNKDHISELQPCIESILKLSTYRNFEVVIVENNSTEPETFAYYKMLEKTYANIHVVVWEDKFNYAAINNFGVGHCTGEHLLFLNNDTTVITPSWIEEMLMYSQREDVGLVGGLLYYPDDTVQHAGLIVGIDAGSQSYAEHLYRGVKRGNPGYWCSLESVRNVSALTGACLMTRRKAFALCNGFDESFAVQFNDIDLCLKAMSLGLFNVFTPYAQLYHFESKSRPLDDSSASSLASYYQARDAFYAKWKLVLDEHDPYYNRNLDLSLSEYSFVYR